MEPKEGPMSETLSSGDVCTKLRRIAEMAREHPEREFRSIHHLIDLVMAIGGGVVPEVYVVFGLAAGTYAAF